jgi:hypothetical protein
LKFSKNLDFIFKKDGFKHMIKLIGALAMLLDHLGAVFMEDMLYSNYYYLRVIGRIAMPLFAFQLVIGFQKTRNVKKYLTRLFFWGIISQIPFYLLANQKFPQLSQQGLLKDSLEFIQIVFTNGLNIMFTFFLAIIGLIILGYTPKEKGKKEVSLPTKKKDKKVPSQSILTVFLRGVGFLVILVLANYLSVDYGIYGILTVTIFHEIKNRKLSLFFFAIMNILFFYANTRFGGQIVSPIEIFSISTSFTIHLVSSIQIFSIISIMFLKNYDPEDTLIIPWKYAFYIYYPLHMLLLVGIKLLSR